MQYSLIIPTLNAGSSFVELLEGISRQSCPPQEIIVIDSISEDGTAQRAREHGAIVLSVKRSEFTHGGARNLAAQRVSSELLVFLTQDVMCATRDALEKLIQPFEVTDIVAVCGRQLPRAKAPPVEAHARSFNYPARSRVKRMADIPELGIKTAFLSNSFAAYRRSTFWEMGGFPDDVIFGEDMILAAKLILAGYGIAYNASACVFHSHDYSPCEQFGRYFDIGVLHARQSWVQDRFGNIRGEGMRYVLSELKSVRKFGLYWICSSLVSSAMKCAGYKLGRIERYLPVSLKRKIGMNHGFWR